MQPLQPLRFIVLACALAPGLFACATAVDEDDRCERDSDCGDFRFCDPSGSCLCRGDEACDAGEFCNLAGSCQQALECFSDDDCATADNPAAICDTRRPLEDELAPEDTVVSSTAGQCITLNASTQQCLLDSHCPFGFFCQPLGGGGAICQPGCRDNGDCVLGDPCIGGQCDASPGACNEVGYCEFGQTCNEGGLRCETHVDADTLCQRCRGDEVQFTCSTCLIDPAPDAILCTEDSACQGTPAAQARGDYCVKFPNCIQDADCPPGETCVEGEGFFDPSHCSGHCGNFFCGNDSCDDVTAPCPRGYQCFQLVRVSNALCTKGGGECASPSTCSADAPGELQESGSCSCTQDSDCPIGDDFQPITCVNPGPNGACVAGSTCGPSSGLTCEDILE